MEEVTVIDNVEHSCVIKHEDILPSKNTTEIIQHDKISTDQDNESKVENSSSYEHNDVTETSSISNRVSKVFYTIRSARIKCSLCFQ